jgi:hypothetical protein
LPSNLAHITLAVPAVQSRPRGPFSRWAHMSLIAFAASVFLLVCRSCSTEFRRPPFICIRNALWLQGTRHMEKSLSALMALEARVCAKGVGGVDFVQGAPHIRMPLRLGVHLPQEKRLRYFYQQLKAACARSMIIYEVRRDIYIMSRTYCNSSSCQLDITRVWRWQTRIMSGVSAGAVQLWYLG